MKPKTLILMLVAVGCGLVAAYLASQVGGGASTTNTVPVVVALVEIPSGAIIKEPEKMLHVKPFLADSAPIERFANLDDLRNKTVGRNIAKGEPITARDFSQHASLFPPNLPGHRAVTIRVTLDGGVAGFALPGSRVDLVCSRLNPGNTTQTITETFMENVLVLAVNALKSESNDATMKSGNVGVPSVVTLAAKPQDAARIIWAKEKGHLTLSLRRPGEDEESKPNAVVELNTTTSPGGKPGGPSSQMIKVWVARADVDPGVIDIAEKAFVFEDVPPTMVPADSFRDAKIPPPSGPGARLHHLVKKGLPVTQAHYKGAGSEVGLKPTTPTGFIWVKVRDGGKDPQYFKFTRDGVPVVDGDSGPAAPTPPSSGGSAPPSGGSAAPSEGAGEKPQG